MKLGLYSLTPTYFWLYSPFSTIGFMWQTHGTRCHRVKTHDAAKGTNQPAANGQLPIVARNVAK